MMEDGETSVIRNFVVSKIEIIKTSSRKRPFSRSKDLLPSSESDLIVRDDHHRTSQPCPAGYSSGSHGIGPSEVNLFKPPAFGSCFQHQPGQIKSASKSTTIQHRSRFESTSTVKQAENAVNRSELVSVKGKCVIRRRSLLLGENG